jgi:hypothetical protein
MSTIGEPKEPSMVSKKKAERLEEFIHFNWLHSMRSAEFKKLEKLRDKHDASKDHSHFDNKKGCKLCGEITKAENAWKAEQMKKMEEAERAD